MTLVHWQDLRYGLRMMLKNPGFTTIVVLTLTLGIGANTAIFSVVNAVLLRPLPYPQAERLMKVNATNLARGITDFGVSLPDFREWARRNQSFERMAAWSINNYNIAGAEEPERVEGAVVSADFFPTLGVSVAQGRGFAREEEHHGKHRVAILSDELWRRRFGENARLNGQTIKLNGELFTIVGVAPRGFQFPERGVKLWLPLTARTVESVMRAGRTRWKIENETFNTLKNQGYHFEHNYGHGAQNLATDLALLMFLAFLVDQIQQRCCQLFRRLWKGLGTKAKLWASLRNLFNVLVFNSMEALYKHMASLYRLQIE
jgi:MacB-like periplasmic core domain